MQPDNKTQDTAVSSQKPTGGAKPLTPVSRSSREQEERQTADTAVKTGIPYYNTSNLEGITTLEGQIALDTLKEYRVAPLHKYSDTSIELGITDQTDRTKLPALAQSLPGVQLTFKTISHAGYNEILDQIFYKMFQPERDGDFKLFGEKLAKAHPKQAFQYIAQLAFWMGASDIHIEPQTEAARIRFRIDGVLHLISTVATDAYKIFLSDLQTKAEIKWGSDDPQSGRISFNLMDHVPKLVSVNMRIETLPTFHGEEIVVRIFNSETRNLRLDVLGYSEDQIKRIDNITSHPSGMLLTVGPTGSGKTSTLYAIINKLNNPEVKISTLEDPVEYDLPGISQIPVHTEDKESFAETLRAVMREDPNVVMIGEIRDVDTAKTALQAALTGHLVLSTFHASSAAAAISRMLDMIGQNPLFASAVRMIIAQRLVRRICPHCIEEVAPTKEQMEFIQKAVTDIIETRRPKIDPGLKLKRGAGCKECHGLGFQGRIAVIEMMPITLDLEKLMTASAKTTAQDLEALAVRNGMATLLEDGLHKALDGITTIDEVMGVVEA